MLIILNAESDCTKLVFAVSPTAMDTASVSTQGQQPQLQPKIFHLPQTHPSLYTPATMDSFVYTLNFCSTSTIGFAHVFQLWIFPEPRTILSSFVIGPRFVCIPTHHDRSGYDLCAAITCFSKLGHVVLPAVQMSISLEVPRR